MRFHGSARMGLAACVVAVGLLCSSGSALAAEAPATREAKSITGTTAVLHGVLNPKAKVAQAVEYQFAYAPSGSECTGGPMVPLTPLSVPGDPGEAVSETLAGLEGSTEYTFCVVANPPGEAPLSGLPSTFKTLPAAPEVDSGSSSAVTPFEATVEALVNPENQPSTSCVFEYGTSTSYGKSVPCAQPVLEGGGDTGASATLTGLKSASPTTTYHYRVVVKNATGEVKGPDGEFTTLVAEKPTVEPGANLPVVTPFEATVEAQVNPDYQETAYSLEYSTTKPAGAKLEGTIVTVEGTGVLNGAGQPVSFSIPGLVAGRTYYYQVLATNATGAGEGAVESFTTLPAEKPTIEPGINPPVVTPFEATLEAQINPDYQETTYSFQYATKATGETLEGTIVTLKGAGPLSGAGAQPAGAPTGAVLTPGKTYYYRATATNKTGTTEGKVEKFETPALIKPVVESENASIQSPFTATLEATVNPEYQETTCTFEYTTEASFPQGSKTTTETCPTSLGNGGGGVGTSVPATGLHSNTKYYFRVIATNTTGTTESTSEFTTQTAEAPSVDGESSSQLSSTGVTLEAQVNPNYQTTTYIFEYATTESLLLEGHGTAVPGGSIPAGFGDQLALAAINRGTLSPDTTYFYRVVATNAAGTTAGMPAVEHFKTLVPPVASTGEVEAITRTTARAFGTVNPEGQDTHVSIEYGPTISYGQSTTTPLDVGAGTTPTPTEAIQLTELRPGTTYHYRVVATNGNNEVAAGEDRQFTTAAPAGPPVAVTGAALEIGQSTATLTGGVSSQGLQATYELDYNQSGYAGCNPENEPGSRVLYSSITTPGETLEAHVGGLAPGSVYHYRTVASTADGVVCSAAGSFTTLGTPIATQTTASTFPNLTAVAPLPGPKESTSGEPKAKPLTNAQKLAKALKACKQKPRGVKRSECEVQARKRYKGKEKSKSKSGKRAK